MSTLARTAAVEWAKAVTADPMTLFLDTETLGRETDSEICDIGIVGIDGRVWLDQLVRPSRPIPAEASAIHGITNEMVADAPSWADIMGDVAEAMTGRRCVIFNAGYDVPIINNANQRAGHPWVISGDCAMLEFAKYKGVPGFKGQYKWHRLELACAEFGITPGGHRALADAIACKDVVCAMAGGQYVCWKCGGRLMTGSSICECLRWVHDGEEHPPADHPVWAQPTADESTRPQPSLFDLPDASRFTR